MSHNYLFCLFKNYPVKLLFPTKKGKDVSWEFRYFKEIKYWNLFTVFSPPFCRLLAVNNRSSHSSVVWAFLCKISGQSVSGLGTSNIGNNPNSTHKVCVLYFDATFGGPKFELGLLVSPQVPMVKSEPLREKEKKIFVAASTKKIASDSSTRATLEENYKKYAN